MFVVMTVRTVLKVPFEKAAPLALPTFRHPCSPSLSSAFLSYFFCATTFGPISKKRSFVKETLTLTLTRTPNSNPKPY